MLKSWPKNKGQLILFLEGNLLIYNMKQKQKALKKLLKDKGSIQRLLDMIGSDTVADHFINYRNHEQRLQEIDPQLLDIVLANILDIKIQSEQSPQSMVKIDVLTLSEAQLLVFCRQKDLINFHQYINTIRNKQYRQHSDYGYKLVNEFPNEFFIGERCTHYHCRTTARKIQSQYGIYHNDTNNQNSDSENIREADSNFINDDQDQSSQQIVLRRKKNSKKKENDKVELRQKVNNSDKKKSIKNVLDSDEQDSGKARSSRWQKRSKMQVSNEDEQISSEDHFLYQILEKLEVDEILEVLEYSSLFQFLSEKYIEKLASIKDQISEVVLFNNKKAKRQQRSASKSKGHKKRLAKAKINLKEIDLEELLLECSKHGLLQAEEVQKWQQKYELEDHPKLAHKLISINPTGYVIEGPFSGSIQQDINQFIEQAYQQYELNDNKQEEFEQLQSNEEDQQSIEQELDDEADQSNYSIDSQEQDLGQL